MTPSTLFVCTTCGSTWKDGQRIGTSAGEWLWQDLQVALAGTGVRIEPVKCLSACLNSCAVAISAPGKFAYLFGQLPAKENRSETVAALVQFAQFHQEKTDGFIPYAERPELLKNRVLGRIPPLATPRS
jgi:predicted metal-binding protein